MTFEALNEGILFLLAFAVTPHAKLSFYKWCKVGIGLSSTHYGYKLLSNSSMNAGIIKEKALIPFYLSSVRKTSSLQIH